MQSNNNCKVSSQGSNKIPLKIELSNQFPKQKPVIHVKRKLSHKYIDSNSWEVIYASFYQWNENSRLVDLVNKIQQEFINHMPAQDPLLLEIENLKSKVNEDQQALALQQTQLNNMFPGLQNGSVKAEDLLKKDGYHEEVQKLESYKKLQGFILELGQKLEFLSNQLDNQAQAINSKKQLLQQQDEQFEAQKSLHLKLHKDSQLLQERFSSNTILSVLDQEIQRLEEITMNQEEIEAEGTQFQDFLKEYHQNKKDFYKLQIKRAKYTQNV
ncbi:Ubiquitin-conjugating enzyme/RWD-like protein [Pseudocohnilembus persalinus]|uniref:Ubiquitin-conjugating enzyme/RWD-like protein n=1 Tax=Pseudocohnilembus persalinus TaxID=266149 RepID=A0A0V0QFK5_PSEPJ|nr:Ubiquitin-conjugating enzyme/RWD-like protein [Pseudocohnilembus persalinus]|eukprot:KRX00995.1 Ubiquitin-conjugating enzyme/RWD-like protein [Pseudocohnilembus persalinus]